MGFADDVVKEENVYLVNKSRYPVKVSIDKDANERFGQDGEQYFSIDVYDPQSGLDFRRYFSIKGKEKSVLFVPERGIKVVYWWTEGVTEEGWTFYVLNACS